MINTYSHQQNYSLRRGHLFVWNLTILRQPAFGFQLCPFDKSDLQRLVTQLGGPPLLWSVLLVQALYFAQDKRRRKTSLTEILHYKDGGWVGKYPLPRVSRLKVLTALWDGHTLKHARPTRAWDILATRPWGPYVYLESPTNLRACRPIFSF